MEMGIETMGAMVSFGAPAPLAALAIRDCGRAIRDCGRAMAMGCAFFEEADLLGLGVLQLVPNALVLAPRRRRRRRLAALLGGPVLPAPHSEAPSHPSFLVDGAAGDGILAPTGCIRESKPSITMIISVF